MLEIKTRITHEPPLIAVNALKGTQNWEEAVQTSAMELRASVVRKSKSLFGILKLYKNCFL